MPYQRILYFALCLITGHAGDSTGLETERQRLFQVLPSSEEHVEILNKLRRNETIEVDFLNPNVKPGSPTRILVAERSAAPLVRALNLSRMQFYDKTDELVRFLKYHRSMASRYRSIGSQSGYDSFSFEKYHPLKEIHGFLKAVNRKFPSITELVQIGASYEGRHMLAIRIGKKKTNQVIWIDAGTHAREWIGPATAVFIVNQLTENYGKRTVVTDLVDKYNFYILPVLNPDGYEYSWTTNRLWRKSRGKTICTFDTCCYGVDLDRNYWFDYETNLNPCRSDYAGPAALSEPETKALSQFFVTSAFRCTLYLTLHSYGQYLEMPFGNRSLKVKRFPQYMVVGRSFIQGASLYKQRYFLTSTYDHAPRTGQAIDWAVYDKEIPFAFSLLQRPYEDSDWGFDLPKDQILPTSRETFEGLLSMVKAVEKYNETLTASQGEQELSLLKTIQV